MAARTKPKLARAASALTSGVGAGAAGGFAFFGVAAGATARGLLWAARQPDVQRVVALVTLAAGLAWSTSAAEARVAAWPRFAVDRSALATSPIPPGFSARAREELAALPLPEGASSFDPRVVPAVHAALGRLPWVRQVEAVRLEAEGGLSFVLHARTPAAKLERDGLVTRDGSVIPLALAANPDALPTFVGVPPVGHPARRPAIEAGLGVLDDLGPLASRVRAIDVGNVGGRASPLASEVVLTLADGLLVEWGRAPDAAPSEPAEDPSGPVVGRPSTEASARRAALTAFLDAPAAERAGVARVSVRWDEVTTVLAPPPPPVAPVGPVARAQR